MEDECLKRFVMQWFGEWAIQTKLSNKIPKIQVKNNIFTTSHDKNSSTLAFLPNVVGQW